MTLEIHSFVSLEVSYIYCNVLNNLLLLDGVLTYVNYLYLSGSTMSLLGGDS